MSDTRPAEQESQSRSKRSARRASASASRITDLASFDDATRGDKAVAGLYGYMHLDVLVELARLVSIDFFARPEIYRDSEVQAVVTDLAKLNARYGCDEEYLSYAQRDVIFRSLFGESEVGSNGATPVAAAAARMAPAGVPGAANGVPSPATGVPTAANAESNTAGVELERFAPERDHLLAATAAFAERVFDTGDRPLLDTVGVMAPGLKSYLSDMNHAMVQWSRDTALRNIAEDTSYKIFRNPGIAAAFGLEPPSEAWPYREEANGTTLVAEVSKRLCGLAQPLTRDRFIDRQRLALRGAEAVATVLDFVEIEELDEDDADVLISKCYTWYAARGRALGLPLETVAVAGAPTMAPSPSDGYRHNRSLFAQAGVGA
jgi:hypothetical protein